jgi:hypothetical protein
MMTMRGVMLERHGGRFLVVGRVLASPIRPWPATGAVQSVQQRRVDQHLTSANFTFHKFLKAPERP